MYILCKQGLGKNCCGNFQKGNIHSVKYYFPTLEFSLNFFSCTCSTQSAKKSCPVVFLQLEILAIHLTIDISLLHLLGVKIMIELYVFIEVNIKHNYYKQFRTDRKNRKSYTVKHNFRSIDTVNRCSYYKKTNLSQKNVANNFCVFVNSGCFKENRLTHRENRKKKNFFVI